jgi:hypothetical protein
LIGLAAVCFDWLMIAIAKSYSRALSSQTALNLEGVVGVIRQQLIFDNLV